MPEEVQAKIEQFFSNYSAKKYSKGQVLLLAGEKSEFIHYLTKGHVKVYDVNYRGDEVVLNIFQPPAFFPMSHAINIQSENHYIYEADTDIEFKRAPNSDVVQFIREHPDVSYNLLSRLYSGVDGLLGRITYLMSSSALARLVYEILIEARRFGTIQEDGSCIINVSEKGLGSRAGLSRETVSREVRKLKAENLIVLGKKNIIIKDLAKLQEKLVHTV